MKEQKVVEPILNSIPEIGRWLWSFQDARKRTMEELSYVTPEMINWSPSKTESSIGSLLYHIAAIEADWLYVEVLEQPFSDEIASLFPHDVRDDAGQLSHAEGGLQEHLSRLESVRASTLQVYKKMDLADFRRPRVLTRYDVTPEWVLHHLMQHEAEHRSKIGWLRIHFSEQHGGSF